MKLHLVNININAKHHTYSKIAKDGKIFYEDYCTFIGLDICSKKTCKILNGGNK